MRWFHARLHNLDVRDGVRGDVRDDVRDEIREILNSWAFQPSDVRDERLF